MTRYLNIFSLFLPVLMAMTFLPNALSAQRTQVDQDAYALFQKARELWDNQKYGAAQAHFEKYRERGENTLRKSEALFYEARCAMELYQKSTQHLFKQYVDKYPELGKKPQAHFYLGKYAFRQKSLEKTRQWLSRIKPQNLPENLVNEHHFMLGYSHYKAGHYDSAKTHLTEIAGEENPYFASANYYYGYIQYEEGAYQQAIERFKKIQDDEKFGKVVPVYITQFHLLAHQYDKVIQFGKQALDRQRVGKQDKIRSYLGQAYFHQKAFEQTIDYLAPLRKNDYDLNKEQRYSLGLAYYKKEEFEKAKPLMESIDVQKDSLGQNIAYHLGDIYAQTDRKEQARNSYEFAAGLSFDKDLKKRSAFHYAKLSYDLGYQQTATEKLQGFIQNYPKSSLASEAQKLLGDILLTTKNYQEALAIIDDIDEPTQKMQEAYQKIAYQRGIELFQDNEMKDTREIFIKALDNPVNPEYKALSYFWLAETYYQLQSFEKASREYQNFLYQDEAPQTAYFSVAYYNLGYSDYKQENYQKAISHFKRFTGLDETQPDDNRYEDALARIADCYFIQKAYEPAKNYYTKVIDEGQDKVPYALYQKGIIQGLMGDNEQKIQTLKNLSQNYGGSQYVDDALFEIGDVYFRQTDYQLALNQFRYLTQDFPKSDYFRPAKLKMAMVYYTKGDDKEALDRLQKIVKEHPYSEEAKEAIDQLKTVYTDLGQADSLIAFLETVESAELSASFKDSATYSSAFSYVRRNDCRGAIKAFEDYLNQYPKGYFSLKAHYYLANCAERENIPDKAITHYKKVVERGSNQFLEPALATLSSIYDKRDNCDKALRYYNQLLQNANKKANQLKALEGQVRCNFQLTQYNDAKKPARQLLRQDQASKKQKTDARYYLAKIYFQEEAYDEALPLLPKVYNNNTGEMGAEAKYLEASIQYEKEQYQQAQQAIYSLKESFANYNYWVAKGFILLGDVFREQGKDFQAKNTLQSIIENYSGEELTSIAQQKLDAIEKRQEEEAEKQQMEPDTINQPENE